MTIILKITYLIAAAGCFILLLYKEPHWPMLISLTVIAIITAALLRKTKNSLNNSKDHSLQNDSINLIKLRSHISLCLKSSATAEISNAVKENLREELLFLKELIQQEKLYNKNLINPDPTLIEHLPKIDRYCSRALSALTDNNFYEIKNALLFIKKTVDNF